jgi:hypothetical protein
LGTVEELKFEVAAAAPTPGTVALRELEIALSPVLDRAASGVEAASDGGVPRRVGVSLPRCPGVVAVAAERLAALPALPALIPERPATPSVLEVTALRGEAALELWIAPDRQGAPFCDAWRPARPVGMAEEDLGDSWPRELGEIVPRWTLDPEGDGVPRLPRGTAPRLVDAPPPSGTALRGAEVVGEYVERFEKLLRGVEVVGERVVGEIAEGERGAADPEETRPVLGVALYVEGALER